MFPESSAAGLLRAVPSPGSPQFTCGVHLRLQGGTLRAGHRVPAGRYFQRQNALALRSMKDSRARGVDAGPARRAAASELKPCLRRSDPDNIEYKIFNVMWCQPLHFEPFRNMLRRDRTPPRKGSERPPSQGTAASLPEAALKNAGTAHAAGSERARRAKQLRADMPTAISRI